MRRALLQEMFGSQRQIFLVQMGGRIPREGSHHSAQSPLPVGGQGDQNVIFDILEPFAFPNYSIYWPIGSFIHFVFVSVFSAVQNSSKGDLVTDFYF